jgi:tungstate transport system ATP-binding protein
MSAGLTMANRAPDRAAAGKVSDGAASFRSGTQPLIELRAATVVLDRRTVLDRVGLAVRPGERVALVGSNGAGKTTLLRLLHGLVPLASGERREGSPDGSSDSSPRRPLHAVQAPQAPQALRMAMVFQRPFMLRTSLLGNVELGLRLQGLPPNERRERAMDALDQVGLAGEALRPGRTLSGGQQQRAALARAWALSPHLLLLDEPTASLDPSAKREIEELIASFSSQGITVVMSSHNLGQVKRLASRVLYLEGGRVLADVGNDHFFHGELPQEAAQFLTGELPWV